MKKAIKFFSFAFVLMLALTLFSCTGGNTDIEGKGIEFNVSETHIQWKYEGEDTWNDIISLDSLKGSNGIDGKNILLQANETHLQWKLEGDTEWKDLISLESLKGEPGKDGVDGTDGKDGVDGTDGKDGVDGTDGKDGTDGTDGIDGVDGKEVEFNVSETHIQWRYVGETEWTNLVAIESLKGAAGENGNDGNDGTNGTDGKEVQFKVTETHIQWGYVGSDDYTNLIALSELIGQDGVSGTDGENGKSAYELYKEAFPEYEGTEEQWILDLVNGELKEKANHTVTFDSNGGTEVASQTVKHLNKITKPANPTKEGYMFMGWFIEEEQWGFHGYVVTEDTILVAKWAEAYTVTFLDHEGNLIETQLVLAGQSAVAPEYNAPEGFELVEWNNDFNNVTENIEVKAIIDVKIISVNIVNTLTNTTESLTLQYNELLERPEEPADPDYYFRGWYFDEDLRGRNKFYFGEPLTDDITLYTRWFENDQKVPQVHVDLANGVQIGYFEQWGVDHKEYKEATISITNTSEEFTLENISGEFSGRGHGSWDNFNKKGYRIKFDSKQSLFGEESNRRWALVAGGHDRAQARHNLAYTFADEVFDHIKYQTSVNIVELYVNGEYRGVYSVFETIRPDKGRADVGDIFGDPEGSGYLVEMDEYARNEDPRSIFFVNQISKPFLIKGPKMENWEDKGLTSAEAYAQRDYIQGYFQQVFNAIFSKDLATFRELADVDSFVDMYLLHEFMKNTDTGWSSFYFYKHAGGKLYLGPAWDFDLSSGSQNFTAGYDPDRGYVEPDKIYVGGTDQYSAYHGSYGQHSELFVELMKQPWFVAAAKARFLEIAPRLELAIEKYYAMIGQQHYVDAYERDKARWNDGMGQAHGNKYLDYKDQQDYLYDWLHARLVWMTDDWASI